jgi:hypothetical protein
MVVLSEKAAKLLEKTVSCSDLGADTLVGGAHRRIGTSAHRHIGTSGHRKAETGKVSGR